MAIQLLQYSTLEVKEYIEEMGNENPLLEINERDGYREGQNYSNVNNDFNYENIIAKTESLSEYINNQLFQCLSEREMGIGRYIVGNLNEQGFLKLEPKVIANVFKVDTLQVVKIIKKIQQLDPLGIAAKNIQESLSIQLEIMSEKNELEQIIVKKYLIKLAEGHFNEILSELDISESVLRMAVEKIKLLNPYPAAGFYQGDNTKYIFPDIVVKKVGKNFILNDNNILPEIKINNNYYSLLKKSRNDEERNYLKKKYKSATWLIRSIEQRQNTIRKISNAIMKKQKDFLNNGIKFLYVMTLNDIAEIIDVHESTVSRATKDKYIQTPQGLFELDFFFSSGIKNLSSHSIKAYIADFINEEDSESPLSDSNISSLLCKRLDINISRRTVAKYRSRMSILSSSKRKKLGRI